MENAPRVALGTLVWVAAVSYAYWLQGVARTCYYDESCQGPHPALVAITYILVAFSAVMLSFGIRGQKEGAFLLVWMYPLSLVGLLILQYGIRNGTGFEGPDGALGNQTLLGLILGATAWALVSLPAVRTLFRRSAQ